MYMKKILVIHNKYQNEGGEDIAVTREIEFLSQHYEVDTLIFQNNQKIGFLEIVFLLINYNFKSVSLLKKKLKLFKPDIVYIHNTWYKASPGILTYLIKNKFKIILKLHNFRYFCTKSFFPIHHFQKMNFCSCCSMLREENKYFNKYFKESYIKSFLVNIYGKKYLKLLKNDNVKVIVLTQFHKNFLKVNQIKNNSVYVNSNPLKENLIISSKKKQKYILYAGRVSQEKGVKELIKAFLNWNNEDLILKIVGDGPELENLNNEFKSSKIHFLGKLENDTVLDLISQSQAVVLNTKLYEGQPTILSEASLLEVPSLFPDTGGISEFFPINYKLMYEQFNYSELIQKFELLKDKNLLQKIGSENRKHLLENYNLNKIIEQFEKILNE